MYKTGIESKNKILEAAKDLFYEKGFSATSCQEIAKKAGVSVGSVNYFFRSKANLGLIVLEEFAVDVRNTVERTIVESGIDCPPLVMAIVTFGINIKLIGSNHSVGRFRREVKMEDVEYRTQYSTASVFVERDYEEIPPFESLEDRRFIGSAVAGMVDRVYAAYYDNEYHYSSAEMITRLLELILYLVRVDHEVAKEYITRGREIAAGLKITVSEGFRVS